MTTAPGPDDPFVAFTGDREAGAALRSNLADLAADHRGTPMGRVLDEVLAGRRPVHDLADDPQFMDLVRDGVQQYRDHLAGLTPEERARFARQVDDLLAEDPPA